MNILPAQYAPLIVCIIIMLLAYLLALKIKFFSLVDVVWAYLFTILAFIYASIPTPLPMRNYALLVIVTFWSMRLGTHLFIRLKSHYPHEDGRYAELRNKWSKNLKLNFLLFYLFQGLSVPILALPILLVGLNQSPKFHFLEILGFAVWLVAIIGESTADEQLKKFKSDPGNRGKVCEVGLWQYSRHPNYFFEWLIWVSYFLIALPAPMGFLAIISPTIMLYLLLRVTGIPHVEAQSLKSRGEAYRQYQSRTSMFVPWIRSKS